MCGICGQAGAPAQPERMRAAMSAMAHRGPDQEGCWIGERVALGHRRLSILDLSEAGRQPMVRDDGEIRVVFNGEIYNFAELRGELEGRHRFRSQTDTEVLVHGYRQWGIDGLLQRIRGMFALALWDSAAGVLHLVRDHLGKKPLFYAVEGGVLRFASTLPALIELLPGAPEVDPGAIRDYLIHLCVPGEASAVRGVRKLLPGHRLEFRAGEIRVHRYWRVSFAQQENRPEEEWLERIDAELRRAVRERLVADVPVGLFLSGGVDSSLVAALMTEESGTTVSTLTAGFTDRAFDERAHARRVAEHLGTRHQELEVAGGNMAQLPHLAHAAGEPFADQAVLPLFNLARAARESVTVVLTGDGGDESFAGYPSVLAARAAGVYQRLVPAGARAAAFPGLLRRGESLGGRTGRYARMLRRMAIPARGRSGLVWEFDPLAERGFRGRLDAVLEPGFLGRVDGDPDQAWREAWETADGPTEVDRALQTDLERLLPDLFLVKSDVATMAFGLEARSPLLDVRLVELAARIPAAAKLRGWTTKRLLKKLALRYVPAEVLFRRKQGFGVPVGSWFRDPSGAAMVDLLLSSETLERGIVRPVAVRRLVEEHIAGRADHGQRLWILLQLELWLRVVVHRTMSPGDTLPDGRRRLAA